MVSRIFDPFARRSFAASANPFWLMATLILACLAESWYQPAFAQGLLSSEKIGHGVIESLRSRGTANVMIMLTEPPSMRASGANLSTMKSEVANVQDTVLASLYTSEYHGRHNFQAVPALAGRVLSEAGLEKLASNPLVVKIDLDVGGGGSLATSVPLIGADKRHSRGITGKGVVVAVLDSGLDTDHSDLADNLIHQECFLDNDGSINGSGRCPNGSDRQSGAGAAEDDHGHGTNVTGIITSKGTVSSKGVAPDASIVAIKVLDSNNTFFFFSEIVAALDFIINSRPDVNVINMSLGTGALFNGNCDTSTAFNMAGAAAINTLRARGVIAFAASGNNGSGTQMTSPACLSNVVSVGATDDSDNVAGFTNSNATTDIMAPGVSITSTGLANGTSTFSGTSQATPHAAGCAALFIDAGVAVTPDAIEALLKSSPVQVTDPKNGLTFPRIDCSPAIDVYFIVDLSGSFSDDLPIFKAQAPTIISTLKGSFPNIRFGLGSFEDYPIPPFGDAGSGDVAYRRNIDLTFDTTAVETVINGLFTRFGADGPQSQLPALFQAATGAGQNLAGVGFPGASIPPGQQANFRDGDAKIFVLWTDAPFHNPGDPGAIPYPGPSFAETVDAILALDPPQVVGISSGGDGIDDLEAIAAATGALAPPGGVDCNADGIIDIPEGEPLVCPISSSGVGIGEAIIALVEAATEPTAMKVDIDVKPGQSPNIINIDSDEVIPVAILTTSTFDATTVDPTTVRFGKTGREAASVQATFEDANGDGPLDLVLHFDTRETGIQCGDTAASLTGKTMSGQAIQGSDAIVTARNGIICK